MIFFQLLLLVWKERGYVRNKMQAEAFQFSNFPKSIEVYELLSTGLGRNGFLASVIADYRTSQGAILLWKQGCVVRWWK